jgi:hypothetical protein
VGNVEYKNLIWETKPYVKCNRMSKVLLQMEMSYILWNSWVHYRLCTSPPLVPIVNSMKAVDILPVFFLQDSF